MTTDGPNGKRVDAGALAMAAIFMWCGCGAAVGVVGFVAAVIGGTR